MLPHGPSRNRTPVPTLGKVRISKQGDDVGRKGSCAMTWRSSGRALRKALDGAGKLGRAMHCGRKSQNGQEKVNKGKKRGDQGEGEAIQPFEHICGGKKSDIRAQYFQQQ